MRGSVAVLMACLLLSGAVLAGCGGGGDEEGSTTTAAGSEAAAAGEARGKEGSGGGESSAAPAPKPLTKAEFAAKANALCSKQKRRIQAKLRKVFKSAQAEGSRKQGPQQAAIRELVEEGIAPAMEAEVDGLRALGAPRGDTGSVEAIVDAIELLVAEARRDPEAFAGNSTAFEKARKLAAAYGIDACGRPT